MRLTASLMFVCALGLSACGGDGGLRTAGSAPGGTAMDNELPLFFKAESPAAGDAFGEGLAFSADGRFLAVGVDHEDGVNTGVGSTLDIEEQAEVGAVYVFRRGDNGWERDAYLKPVVAVRGARFGYRLALAAHGDGYTLLVGAPGDPGAGTGVGADPDLGPTMAGSGAAHVFERDGNGVWRQTAYIKAPFAVAGLGFGSAVSLSLDGQWAAVGMPGSLQDGGVALYQRGLNGWGWVGNLGGRTSGGDGDDFGRALQLDARGEHLLVGAPAEDKWRVDGSPVDDGTNDAGGAYVFQRDGNAWSEVAHLNATDATQVGWFGQAVAMSSDAGTLVIGEPLHASGMQADATGRVHVYQRDATGWRLEQAFISPDAAASGTFGDRLALSADGSTLAIANPHEDGSASGIAASPVFDPRVPMAGAVYVYRRSVGGPWSSSPGSYLKAPNNRQNLRFGWSLALSALGDTLAVAGFDHSASPAADGPTNEASAMDSGAVYLY